MKMPNNKISHWSRLCNKTWVSPYHITHKNLNRLLKKSAKHAKGKLLDIGCGNKPYYEIFKPHVNEYIGLEVPFTPSKTTVVNVFGSGLILPIKDNSIDTVLGTCVLEHVPEPIKMFEEAYRILKKNGMLIMTIPQTWGVHEAPHDYYRYTNYGIKYLAEKAGFKTILIEQDCGTWATVAQRLSVFIYGHYGRGGSNKKASYILKALFTPVHMIFQIFGYYFDILNKRQGDPLNYLLIAKK